MDYRFVHSIVKEVYTDIPTQRMPPQSHLRELRRYAGAFDSLEIGLEESYCYFNVRIPGEDPIVYLGKTGRKHNAVSEGIFLQCAGWKQAGQWNTGDSDRENEYSLLDHFDEILGTPFYTETELDGFADLGMVPSEEGNPVPRPIQDVKVDREAIRAVLYGVMLRWQQGTPQIHIAVPKAEMGRYNDYVLGAVKTIWSYFPAYMRAAVGFASYLSPRRERDFPKFSLIFVPYHMEDVNTIRLDGSSPNAYAAMIRSTGMQQMDLVLETLASLHDPEERKSFLHGIFEDVEREADLNTRSFSSMAYVKWGRGLELLNAKGGVSELIPEWVKFAANKERFPAAISRKVDQYIDQRLSPEELNKALEQELRGGRPSEAALEKIVERYLPLCASRPACKEALWIFLRDSLGKMGLPAETIYQILGERESVWGELTDKKSYGECRVNYGRQAAQTKKARAEARIREAGKLAMQQERLDSFRLRDGIRGIRRQFREETAPFVDEVSLRELDEELRQLERDCVADALDRELQLEAAEQPRGHQAVQAEQKRVAALSGLLPADRNAREQELFLRLQDRQNQLESLLTHASTVSVDLQQRLQGIDNYFEALDEAAESADLLSKQDRVGLRSILAEKRPNMRAGYLEAFRLRYGHNLSFQALKKKKGFFRDCVEEDLVHLFDAPQALRPKKGNPGALLRQIQTIRRESELFGADHPLQITLDGDPLDVEMAERVLGLQPEDVAGREKQRVGETSMQLLRAGVFGPDHLCAFLKLFEAAECKLDKPVKAVLGGEVCELNREQTLGFLRQILEIQQSKGMDRKKALDWISEKLDAAGSNPVAIAAFKTLAAEGKPSGKGRAGWIVLCAVLTLLLAAAVLWIVLRPAATPPEEPTPTEEAAVQPDGAILSAYQDPDARALGRFDLNGRGIDNEKLQEVLGYYQISAAFSDGEIPQTVLENPNMLKELGYLPVLDLSNNPALSDLSGLGGLAGLRRLYLDGDTGLRSAAEVDGLPYLELLSLRGTQIPEEDILRLSGSNPDCLILWNQGEQEKLFLTGCCYTRGERVLDLSGHGAALIRVLDEKAVAYVLDGLLELHLGGAPLQNLDGLGALGALKYLDLSNAGLTDDQLPALHGMKSLAALDLSGSDVSDNALQELAATLDACVIFASPIPGRGEADLVTICGMQVSADTEILDLSGQFLWEQDKEALLSLTRLTQLDLSDAHLDDLTFLQGMPSLRRLNIRGNEVTDLSPLWKLPQLELVYADGNPIRELGLSEKTPAPYLHILSLSCTEPDLDLSKLRFAPSLRVLDLGEFRESADAPLTETFQALTGLRVLRLLSEDRLTPESLAALPEYCAVIPTAAAEPAAQPETPAPSPADTAAAEGQPEETNDPLPNGEIREP